MCDPISAIVVGGLMAGASVAQGQAAKDAAQKQMDENKRLAENQAREAENLQNSTAQKARKASVDPATALYGSQNKGVGSTSLTGPQGVDTSQLMLGKNSLLGS